MRVVRSAGEIAPGSRGVVAIGVFDGVHAGHREIIDRVVRLAAASSVTPTILTFEPHPRAVLKPASPSRVLTPIDEKLRILERLGVDMAVVVPFDRAFAAMSAEQFVRAWLSGRFTVSHVVVGYDFRLGHAREGNSATLAGLGSEHGFAVETVPPFMMGDRPVKSTRIRDEIERGNIAEASVLLERFHSLRGVVVGGDARGRTLGYPTANVAVYEPGKLWPANGVYAVLAETPGRLSPGVANLGVRPTLGAGGEQRLEVHVLGLSEDLTGAPAAVHFVSRLRDERAFPSLDALVDQIGADCLMGEQALSRVDKKFVFTRL